MMPSHKYEIQPGFIGPLTRKRTLIRERNARLAPYRAEKKRLARLCKDGTENHDWKEWDCGCSFGCGSCSYFYQCSKCGRLK